MGAAGRAGVQVSEQELHLHAAARGQRRGVPGTFLPRPICKSTTLLASDPTYHALNGHVVASHPLKPRKANAYSRGADKKQALEMSKVCALSAAALVMLRAAQSRLQVWMSQCCKVHEICPASRKRRPQAARRRRGGP